MLTEELNAKFWQKKKVLITGHNGFKGTWLCTLLDMLNAEIFGISLPPETDPAMCNVIGLQDFVSETVLDVRDLPKLTSLVSSISPDIIIHMAAQSLVSAGYSDPVNTFSTNVMGTVNLLEASRTALSDKNVLILIVSSDKCYLNNEVECI